MRPLAEKRHNDFKKAIRKRNIDREVRQFTDKDWYDNLHQYSKNKIHCSCPLCCAKTDRNAKEGNPIPDRRKIEAMDDQEKELEEI